MSLKSIKSNYIKFLQVLKDNGMTLNESQKETLDNFMGSIENTIVQTRDDAIRTTKRLVEEKLEKDYKAVFESILSHKQEHSDLSEKIQTLVKESKDQEPLVEAIDAYLDKYVEEILPKKTIVDYERLEKLEKIQESLKDLLQAKEIVTEEKKEETIEESSKNVYNRLYDIMGGNILADRGRDGYKELYIVFDSEHKQKIEDYFKNNGIDTNEFDSLPNKIGLIRGQSYWEPYEKAQDDIERYPEIFNKQNFKPGDALLILQGEGMKQGLNDFINRYQNYQKTKEQYKEGINEEKKETFEVIPPEKSKKDLEKKDSEKKDEKKEEIKENCDCANTETVDQGLKKILEEGDIETQEGTVPPDASSDEITPQENNGETKDEGEQNLEEALKAILEEEKNQTSTNNNSSKDVDGTEITPQETEGEQTFDNPDPMENLDEEEEFQSFQVNEALMQQWIDSINRTTPQK